MKIDRNENGYILVIVLMTIMLITTFALVLLPKAISTMKQVGISESSSQTKQMAEMGVQFAMDFLQNQVTQPIAEVKQITLTNKTVNHDKLFCERLTARLNTTTLSKDITMEGNPGNSFQVSYLPEPRTIVSKDMTTCDGFKSMKIPVQSTGNVEGKGIKQLQAYFLIDNKGEILSTQPSPTTPVDPNTLPMDPVIGIIDLSGKDVSDLYRSAKFIQTIIIKGNAILSVGGNAWLNGGTSDNPYTIDFRGNNGILIVSGNAYFRYPISFGGAGRNYVCVKGNAYLYNNSLQRWDPYPAAKTAAACPQIPEVQNRVEYFFDYNEWDLNRDKLDVQY